MEEAKELLGFVFSEDVTPDAYPKEQDEAVIERAKAMEEALSEELSEYDETAADFEMLLRQDHELLEQLADESAVLALTQLYKEEDAVDDDTLELAYLNVIDKLYELSKTYHPLSEMGKDRLWAALSITQEYEEKYRPLLSQITADNADRFAHLMTERYYTDVVNGRKNAIGALRYEDGTAYAAGVVVYHFDIGPVTESPVLRIDYVYVGEEYRQHGVGNQLFGRMMCFAAQYEHAPVTVAYAPPSDPDEKQAEDMTVIMNCLDSWQFDFSMNYGKEYYVSLSSLKGNAHIDREVSGVTPLKSLGKAALGRFFKERNDADDREIAGLPFEYFDGDVSCAAAENGRITCLLLVHRYASGGYRIEFLGGLSDEDEAAAPVKLLCFAYRAYAAKGEEGGTVSGEFSGEESMDIVRKIVPDAKMFLTYEGILIKPSITEDITSRQWKKCAERIGLTDIVRHRDEQEPGEEVMTGMYEALTGIAGAFEAQNNP